MVALVADKDRYVLNNIRWVRTGARSGFLRKRRWKQRTWNLGGANDLVVAAALLAEAPLSYDEAVFLYDMADGGRRIAARYGQAWKHA